jgi:hypothetical protein
VHAGGLELLDSRGRPNYALVVRNGPTRRPLRHWGVDLRQGDARRANGRLNDGGRLAVTVFVLLAVMGLGGLLGERLEIGRIAGSMIALFLVGTAVGTVGVLAPSRRRRL